MPEGPEVCITAQYLKSKLKNRHVTKLEILSGRYTHGKLKGAEYLDGKTHYIVNDVSSKGKLLWMTMTNSKDTTDKLYLISHFGLTGGWSFHKSNSDRIRLIVNNEKKKKKYHLYYSDDRNFGTIGLTKDLNDVTDKTDKLAPDLLKTEFTPQQFLDMVNTFVNKSSKRKDMILGKVLMNQNKSNSFGSGLGNYLTPEILYDAKLSPFRTLGSLSDTEIKTLGMSVKRILKLSYYNNTTGYMNNFESFVDSHKLGIKSGKYPDYHSDIKLKSTDEFEFKVYRLKTDKLGNPVKKDTSINDGRTTYWVPNVQK